MKTIGLVAAVLVLAVTRSARDPPNTVSRTTLPHGPSLATWKP